MEDETFWLLYFSERDRIVSLFLEGCQHEHREPIEQSTPQLSTSNIQANHDVQPKCEQSCGNTLETQPALQTTRTSESEPNIKHDQKNISNPELEEEDDQNIEIEVDVDLDDL